MSVLVYDQPESYSLAYNDNPYVFASTNYGTGQRFQVSVVPIDYPTSPVLSTERILPRQGVTQNGVVTEDRTYYDPSRILSTQVNPKVAIPAANHAGYFDAASMLYKYKLFIREELLSGGVYSYGDSWLSNEKTVWNGVRNTRDWLSFDYTDYDMNTAVSSKAFLTDSPSTLYVDSDQSLFLHFFSSDKSIDTVKVSSFDANGSLVNGEYSITMASEFGYIPVGPYDIENCDSSIWTSGNPATVLNGATGYRIALEGGSQQETITINIDQRCSKYTPIRLHWLNRLGGFDSFNFSLKNMEETEIDRRTYHQQHHKFTGTRWQYDQASRGQTDYFIGTSDKLTVNTPYLSETESIWMNDFATSPLVYQELDNGLIAMAGRPKRISKQTSLNDKLMQYEFELDYSLTNIRQRG